eukprot:scaffold72570_cov44-Phaeocystis_antarctica.AAC.2
MEAAATAPPHDTASAPRRARHSMTGGGGSRYPVGCPICGRNCSAPSGLEEGVQRFGRRRGPATVPHTQESSTGTWYSTTLETVW